MRDEIETRDGIGYGTRENFTNKFFLRTNLAKIIKTNRGKNKQQFPKVSHLFG
jgi:hypothetical protein